MGVGPGVPPQKQPRCSSPCPIALCQDDLRPLSCNGSDSQGGIGLTTLDSLDTLLVRTYSLEQGVRGLHRHLSL